MKKTFIITLVLFFIVIFCTAVFSSEAQIIENYGNIPLAFTRNQGQVDSQVKFTTNSSGCSMFFTPAGTTFLLSRETVESRAKRTAKRSVVYMNDLLADNEPDIELDHFALKLNFLNANPDPEIVGEDRLSWNSNYFIGNDPSEWRTDVPNYSKIRLKDIYDGIDLVYYGVRKSIKYDFVVQPGENPSEIMLNYDFGDSEGSLSINEKGELVVSTPLGDIIEQKPYCYQTIEGENINIDISYEIVDSTEGSFTFSIGNYNHDYSLVIDPEIVYSTFIGDFYPEKGYSIAVDGNGCAYVTGYTQSPDFPVTPGAFSEVIIGSCVFAVKLNAEGSDLVYATFIYAGTAGSIAVDDNCNAYVVGSTSSTDFPVTSGAYDETHNGYDDFFILKLNADGTDLCYSTYVGGKSTEYIRDMTIDENGCVYVGGDTMSKDFPVTVGAFDETHNGGILDAVILKLNADGSDLDYSTFIGGSGSEAGIDIALDSSCCLYGTGVTESTDFPVTSGAFDETFNDGNDVFILKLNPEGSELIYATLAGGSDYDNGADIIVDKNEIAYVIGITKSADFPVTPGAFDETFNGLEDTYILKLNADGSDIYYSTYIGGNDYDKGLGIAVDNDGSVYITGMTESIDFPVTSGAFDEIHNGQEDVFISKLNYDGSNLDYSTFFGGSNISYGSDLVMDTNGNVYVTGYTVSSDFPVTSGAFDESFNLGEDIFVIKFSFDVENVFEIIPPSFRISAPYPNPFNPFVTLEYEIPADCFVKLVIYDVLGREVSVLQKGILDAGAHRAVWNGKNSNGEIVGSGVYLYRFEADNNVINGPVRRFTMEGGKVLFLK